MKQLLTILTFYKPYVVWSLIVKICIVILLSLFILNGNAESLWTTDGDLIIVEGESDTKINIDLENQLISVDGANVSESFDIDPYKKTCMINGYDDIDYLISKKDKIEAFAKFLKSQKISVTIRQSLGASIMAGCGQLAGT